MMLTRYSIARSALVLAMLAAAVDASAQDAAFARLSRVLELGQRVIVVEDDGHVWRGGIVSIDANQLDLRWRRWIFAHREQIVRQHAIESIAVQDSEWNGALAGAGLGALAGWLIGNRTCTRDLCLTPALAYMGAWAGTGIGGAIDRSMNEVVYQSSRRDRVSVVPAIGRHQVGLVVAASFHSD